MNAPLLFIPLALEWVILITALAPLVLVNKFRARPQLGIAVWLSAFLSAGLATIAAIVIAVWAYFETWNELNNNSLGGEGWISALVVSFAPWIALAVGGISLALINQRIEPLIATAREIEPLINLSKRPLMNFMGTQVSVVELPFAYALATRKEILISSFVVEHLSKDELDAVLWHELGHVKHSHFQIKRLAGFIKYLSIRVAASRALVFEIDILCEISADKFALKNVSAPTLKMARSLFTSL